MGGGTADKDFFIRFLQHVSLPHGIIIDAIIVQANRCQGCKHTATNPLRDQGVHLEASLVKAKRRLGVPRPSPSMTSQRARAEMAKAASWVATSCALWSTAAFSS